MTRCTRHAIWTARAMLVTAVVWSGCAELAAKEHAPAAIQAGAVLRGIALDRATEDRVLALDPDHISERELQATLALAPAPRIIHLQGSVPLVTMRPFAEFLIAMGYPPERLRNPRDGAYSYSSFVDSRQLAGVLAWHYEREGMVPMLVGHSRGGMLTTQVLQDLADTSGDRIAVWNPLTDAHDGRFVIVDPLTGAARTVVGLQVPYATALATGSVMRVVLGEWGMLSRLRSVPDTVGEFTGFFIEWDPVAGTFPGSANSNPYRPTGSAAVRNVTLPSDYGHVSLPLTTHLAANPVTRTWISRYSPRGEQLALPNGDNLDLRNILHAADIWYSVKKHWCLEAQRLIRAKRRLVETQN